LGQLPKDERRVSVLATEYSVSTGDPYYPVPNDRNRELFLRYKELGEKERDVIFVGRLASYKYFNMDEAIYAALECCDNNGL
jgi:UDP-galactopyranose mutase